MENVRLNIPVVYYILRAAQVLTYVAIAFIAITVCAIPIVLESKNTQ